MSSHMNNDMVIFSGSSHPELADEISRYLGTKLGSIQLSRFSCGEIYARIKDNVRGRNTYVIQTASERVNEDLIELFIIIDALKRASAESISVVIPHFPYSRQDKKSASREPISARLIADLLTTAGIDRIITMDLHSDQIQGFFNVPVDNLTAIPILASYIKERKLANPVVIAPDTGRAKTAKKLADRILAPLAILHKTRPEHNKAAITHIVGDVSGKTCIIVDDMVDTAGTATSGVKTLLDNGANPDIYLVATHGILSGGAVDKFKKAGMKEVTFTNSIPVPDSKRFTGLNILSAAPLLGEAIKRAYENQSISSLFD